MVYLFLLLYQHGQENGFKGHGVIRLADSGRMQTSRREKGIKVALVGPAQDTAEVGKRRFFLLDELIGGWQRSTHLVAPKKVRVGRRPFLPIPSREGSRLTFPAVGLGCPALAGVATRGAEK